MISSPPLPIGSGAILYLLLQFIKIMIYFSKMIDICINRYGSQKRL